MTKEEAINRLRNMTIEISDYCNASKHMSEADRQDMETFDMAIKALEQESKKGHWIKEKTIYGWDGCSYQCSKCGRSVHLDTAVEDINLDYPYCHCGVKMEGVEE